MIIKTKRLTIPSFLLIESLLFVSLKNVETLAILIFKHENYKKIKERLNDIFYYQKELLLTNKEFKYNTKDLTIDIRNLSFTYYDNKILNNINLKINPKDKIFLYGPSGSGKSTLVKLIGRYFSPKYNDIKLGNIDITHYNLATLRDLITYISSDNMLGPTKIKDNIYLNRKPQMNQKELLKITGLTKMFKEKNYNLDTILDTDGDNLSMGEKSRINLAQALFKQSEIYILDECLSNVDIELEKEILKNILNYYHDKIIIYISHRMNNKDLFNRVIYMDKGKCNEVL